MKNTSEDKCLNIVYLNTYGQTLLSVQKQFQIEGILKKYKCDILHLQESNIDDNTFDN